MADSKQVIEHPLLWGAVVAGTVLWMGVGGALLLHPGSNLAPIIGFVLVFPAFIIGTIAGALVSRFRVRRRNSVLLMAITAAVCGLAPLALLGEPTQDDSEILAAEIGRVPKRIKESGRDEIIAFQPPVEAGRYEILIRIEDASLAVSYPETERGRGWGHGRAWISREIELLATHRIEKRPGERTEIVLRMNAGGLQIVELR